MISWTQFEKLSLEEKIDLLYKHGNFVMGIRYYNFKVNLYLFHDYYLEVFINHKNTQIENISILDSSHTRMKFYSDQIKLPAFIRTE